MPALDILSLSSIKSVTYITRNKEIHFSDNERDLYILYCNCLCSNLFPSLPPPPP